MAIKGKRKPQKRGRPAPAARPRPVAARPASGARVPFYRTFRGQLTAIVAVLALIGAGIWFYSDRRADSQRLSQRQERLDAYTREVRALLEDTSQSIRELAGAPVEWAAAPVHEGYLATGSKRWVEAFQASGAAVGALQAPEGLQGASSVLLEAFQVYTSAARTFGNAAELGGDSPSEREDRQDITQGFLDRAREQRESANRMVVAVIQLIDAERASAEMKASELQAPGSLPPVTPPEGTAGADKSKKKEKDE